MYCCNCAGRVIRHFQGKPHIQQAWLVALVHQVDRHRRDVDQPWRLGFVSAGWLRRLAGLGDPAEVDVGAGRAAGNDDQRQQQNQEPGVLRVVVIIGGTME
jgi:hypothetical protein